MNVNLHCKVCGLKQSDPESFWGQDGETPSYMICDCCGAEFGNDDLTPEDVRAYREKWLKSKKWFNEDKKPDNWSFEDQKKNIPQGF